jgi:hypothetical protein
MGFTSTESWSLTVGFRIPETLDVYFQKKLKKFLIGNLRHIDVERITDRPRYTVGYALKGLKRPTFSEDDVLVLPRDVSELPVGTVVPAGGLFQGDRSEGAGP